MEIKVFKDNQMSEHDTGRGYREVSAEIHIDASFHPRLQRHVLIYEVLGLCFDKIPLIPKSDILIIPS